MAGSRGGGIAHAREACERASANSRHGCKCVAVARLLPTLIKLLVLSGKCLQLVLSHSQLQQWLRMTSLHKAMPSSATCHSGQPCILFQPLFPTNTSACNVGAPPAAAAPAASARRCCESWRQCAASRGSSGPASSSSSTTCRCGLLEEWQVAGGWRGLCGAAEAGIMPRV